MDIIKLCIISTVLDVTEGIFAVLYVSTMGLTRFYKTTVFLHLSETKGQGWRVLHTQWRKASDILSSSTLAALLFSCHPKRERDREATPLTHSLPHSPHLLLYLLLSLFPLLLALSIFLLFHPFLSARIGPQPRKTTKPTNSWWLLQHYANYRYDYHSESKHYGESCLGGIFSLLYKEGFSGFAKLHVKISWFTVDLNVDLCTAPAGATTKHLQDANMRHLHFTHEWRRTGAGHTINTLKPPRSTIPAQFSVPRW